GLVLVPKPEPPRVLVTLATLGPPGKPTRAERFPQHQPGAHARLVAALRSAEKHRVVEQMVVLFRITNCVAVDDEPGVLVAVPDRLAHHRARPVPDEVLNPRDAQPPERPGPVVCRRAYQCAGHRSSPAAGRRPSAGQPCPTLVEPHHTGRKRRT